MCCMTETQYNRMPSGTFYRTRRVYIYTAYLKYPETTGTFKWTFIHGHFSRLCILF